MADFRRVVTALAVVFLLGLISTANAQPTVPAFACTATAAAPPLLRAEGLTELTGDVVLNCSGGVPVSSTAGTAIPTANFTVFLGNTNITSRILDTNNNLSEALLLIDEPTSTLPGAPAAYITIPSASAVNGCSAPGVTGGCVVGSTIPNVYQGIVSGNTVTFLGVPVNPPGTAGTRIFRITNVRANAAAVGAAASGAPNQITAYVAISGPTAIPVNNPTQVVGFVQKGLNFSMRTAANDGGFSALSFGQCVGSTSSGGRTRLAIARFAENFATAFKLQGTTAQTMPGTIYNTESGLVFPNAGTAGSVWAAVNTLGGTTARAGLADYGTRLKATFNNIPTGVALFVNVASYGTGTTTVGTTANTPYAVLIGYTGGQIDTIPNATPGSPIGLPGTVTTSSIPLAQVTLTGGSGSATWEVVNVSSLAIDTLDFGIYGSWTANQPGNSPAVGVQGTVSGTFAPIYVPPTGASASSTLPIPRFVDLGTGGPNNFIIFTICRTTLLFPYLTNQAGFDTGIAISNTTKDPFGTAAQTGVCHLNFYGPNAPAAYPTKSLTGGDQFIGLASDPTIIPAAFTGYMIAVCDFQLAHGFAFVSDLGAQKLAMGYLALVVPEVPRNLPAAGESLGM